jgi:hypothetical protein
MDKKSAHINRQPKGRRDGGQFSPSKNPESNISLASESPVANAQANAASAGLVPAFRWWHRMKELHRERPDGDEYPVMRTQSMGLPKKARHSHRMTYSGEDVSLLMPSVSAVKRYSQGQSPDGPFDIPVTANFNGGQIDGFVRVVTDGKGRWATMPIGFPREQAGTVAESVHCLLEARRPSRALAETGDIMERRRRRRAETGAHLEPVKSTWIKAAGYDHASGVMLMAVESKGSEKVYAYRASLEDYLRVVEDPVPGRVFNKSIRMSHPRVDASRCSKCHNVFVTDRHRCAIEMNAPGRYLAA